MCGCVFWLACFDAVHSVYLSALECDAQPAYGRLFGLLIAHC